MVGRVLLIAGSDSSGGAGLEAGQKVLAAHKCYAMTATTALTVQNTTGVKAVHIIPSDFVEQQIEACLEDIGADVVTTGMLANADTIKAVARQLKKHNVPALVVDPVITSTTGVELLPRDAIRSLSEHLLPLTTILTPNIPEAKLILTELGRQQPPEIKSLGNVEALGRQIQTLGPKWVLIKGGHLPFREDLKVAQTEFERNKVVDVLLGPEGFSLHVEGPWQESTGTHGTGCSLAAAISAGIAKGSSAPDSVVAACQYVAAGIWTAPKLGAGYGPLGHFHSIDGCPFSKTVLQRRREGERLK